LEDVCLPEVRLRSNINRAAPERRSMKIIKHPNGSIQYVGKLDKSILPLGTDDKKRVYGSTRYTPRKLNGKAGIVRQAWSYCVWRQTPNYVLKNL
jgi:hypothetical protein